MTDQRRLADAANTVNDNGTLIALEYAVANVTVFSRRLA